MCVCVFEALIRSKRTVSHYVCRISVVVALPVSFAFHLQMDASLKCILTDHELWAI